MRFLVEWLPDAEDDLAAAWMQAPDRQVVTDAQAVIDRLLARDPLTNGAEVAEGLRKFTVAPLVVYYEVDTGRRHVTVTNVALVLGTS